jgi:hypothetical protein
MSVPLTTTVLAEDEAGGLGLDKEIVPATGSAACAASRSRHAELAAERCRETRNEFVDIVGRDVDIRRKLHGSLLCRLDKR